MICAKCALDKPDEAFRPRKTCPGGRSPTCRQCHAEVNKRWRAANPDKVKANLKRHRDKNPDAARTYALASHFRRKFGLTMEEREELTRQGKCDICGTLKPQKKGWCIDHDHKTGRIRGILCQKCNSMIGLANESQAVLTQAIIYLEAHDAARPD